VKFVKEHSEDVLKKVNHVVFESSLDPRSKCSEYGRQFTLIECSDGTEAKDYEFGGPEPTKISVSSWFCPLSTILHELIHCVGVDHEHQRWDRDDYIIGTFILTR